MNMRGFRETRKIGVITKSVADFIKFAREKNLILVNHSAAQEKNHDIKYYHISSIEKSRGCELHDIIIYGDGDNFPHSMIKEFRTMVRL